MNHVDAGMNPERFVRDQLEAKQRLVTLSGHVLELGESLTRNYPDAVAFKWQEMNNLAGQQHPTIVIIDRSAEEPYSYQMQMKLYDPDPEGLVGYWLEMTVDQEGLINLTYSKRLVGKDRKRKPIGEGILSNDTAHEQSLERLELQTTLLEHGFLDDVAYDYPTWFFHSQDKGPIAPGVGKLADHAHDIWMRTKHSRPSLMGNGSHQPDLVDDQLPPLHFFMATSLKDLFDDPDDNSAIE